VADGKLLASQTLPLGPFYSLSLASDARTLAVGAGPRGRQGLAGTQDGNPAYILKMPAGQ
jgi:hypothetical protein